MSSKDGTVTFRTTPIKTETWTESEQVKVVDALDNLLAARENRVSIIKGLSPENQQLFTVRSGVQVLFRGAQMSREVVVTNLQNFLPTQIQPAKQLRNLEAVQDT